MKLSEAIREGAKLRPQCFGNSFSENENGELCSCAWGAAHEAIAGRPLKNNESAIMWTTHLKESNALVENPVTKKAKRLSTVITDLNDSARWTREQIADWLEKEGY